MSADVIGVGAQVRLTRPRSGLEPIGLVTSVGGCDWPKCTHGDDCITIAVSTKTGGVSSINVTPEDVEVIA
jgi:hypothetical protein